MTKTATPFGFWPSDWSAEKAASASRDFAEIRAGHDGLFWIEYDPTDARCTLWYWRYGQLVCATPAGRSVRSRVYEYGGGAFCVTTQGVAFVDETDQQIHLQSFERGRFDEPVALTACPDCRYGDLQFDSRQSAIIAVEGSHAAQPVVHRLVSFSTSDGARSVLGEGADFYSSAVVDAQSRRMAWIQWLRPEQPWTATSLWMAERGDDGAWRPALCLAGAEGGESLQQPRFTPNGTLYCLSDRAGWWQPWREQCGRLVPAFAPDADVDAEADDLAAPYDHAPAPWQLGTVSYLPLADGGLLLTRMIDGYGLLFEHNGDGQERQLATGFDRCRQLAADDRYFYCIAGAANRAPAVLAITRLTGEVRIVAGGAEPLSAEQLSRPQPFSFATAHGETAHAFFYPPSNADYRSLTGEKPPLVVFLHGGPTSACYPVFDPRIQYWTQRGFAVADLNYRGSSGFGRAYRQRLKNQWGMVDVEDAAALVRALNVSGQIDPARTFIRGSSAGGYTALCALASDSGFRGGASLYGVSDPLALRRVTHKFEADYLDWLIGDPEQHADRYRQRAPLNNAARIKVPVIFFQGGKDAVVLPEQTESMVDALKRQGIAVEYRLYPQERHGFRQAANLADALECEYRFYQRLLG
ncbi:alpha/beta hydrolase family protein [Stutzerimonas stutzeri]|uniref:alpha/beta hydrolase family protein n=1 Tax=Stutzerimonas stutzeri TaxID=316 RepID=UPI00039742DF|nr:S9 family peptidase [Stutzerimonas stutzeri]EQM79414.1 peptidase S9 [Stutzerimonas stutzeri MF28]